MFRASDPRIAADKPRGEITARELLDASTKQIESGFAGQPETQIELLGVVADIYRELDESKQSSALYAQETALASRYLGPTDRHVIDGLLGQADNADDQGDDELSLRLLTQVDPLIRRADLQDTSVRARWLVTRGEALFGDAANADEARMSLESAAELFRRTAPEHPRYPDALSDLGALSFEQSRFAGAADYYRKTITVAKANPILQGDLLLAFGGLALSLEHLADFDGAEVAFEHGADIAARTYGRGSQKYRLLASDWAQFRYERGDRDGALAAFENILQFLPTEWSAYRNATDALEAAQVLRKFGHCLAVDGQGARSIQLLEQAKALVLKSATHAYDNGRLELDLGSAYAAGGRTQEAYKAFTRAIALWREQRAPSSMLANAFFQARILSA